MNIRSLINQLFFRRKEYSAASPAIMQIKAPAVAAHEISRVHTRCGIDAAEEFRTILESSPAQISGNVTEEDCRIYYAVLANAYLLCREEAWKWKQLRVMECARGA